MNKDFRKEILILIDDYISGKPISIDVNILSEKDMICITINNNKFRFKNFPLILQHLFQDSIVYRINYKVIDFSLLVSLLDYPSLSASGSFSRCNIVS